MACRNCLRKIEPNPRNECLLEVEQPSAILSVVAIPNEHDGQLLVVDSVPKQEYADNVNGFITCDNCKIVTDVTSGNTFTYDVDVITNVLKQSSNAQELLCQAETPLPILDSSQAYVDSKEALSATEDNSCAVDSLLTTNSSTPAKRSNIDLENDSQAQFSSSKTMPYNESLKVPKVE